MQQSVTTQDACKIGFLGLMESPSVGPRAEVEAAPSVGVWLALMKLLGFFGGLSPVSSLHVAMEGSKPTLALPLPWGSY